MNFSIPFHTFLTFYFLFFLFFWFTFLFKILIIFSIFNFTYNLYPFPIYPDINIPFLFRHLSGPPQYPIVGSLPSYWFGKYEKFRYNKVLNSLYKGGFQLLDLIITELKKSHDLLKIQGLSLVEILFVKKIIYKICSPV